MIKIVDLEKIYRTEEVETVALNKMSLEINEHEFVAVTRAVVNTPKLILADEPTGNLDSRNGKEVMAMLTELNKAGTTIVMVTHSEHDASFAQRIVRMLDGKPVAKNFRL